MKGLTLAILSWIVFAFHGSPAFAQSSPGMILTIAGTSTAGFSGDGGPPASAMFNSPHSVAILDFGWLIIADTANRRVRSIENHYDDFGHYLPVVKTVAGENQSLFYPWAMVLDARNNLFIADPANHRVYMTPWIFSASRFGDLITIAGNGTPGFTGDGGPATAAQLDSPLGIAVDKTGNVYIADTMNNRIRKVARDGTISTVAGSGSFGKQADGDVRFAGDGGPAAAARLNQPSALALDLAGNLIIADTGNSRIRRVIWDGGINIINTVAGNGRFGSLGSPQSVSLDGSGNMFVADSEYNQVFEITPEGALHVAAGNGTAGWSGDGGPAPGAQLAHPFGVAASRDGLFYIADSGNNRIRSVNKMSISSGQSAGTAETVALGYGIIRSPGYPGPTQAVVRLHQNGVLVSQTNIPATPLIRSGRIYAEVNGTIDTGVSLVNPNGQAATVSFYFTNRNGDFGQGSTIVPSGKQVVAFLSQAPFNALSFQGTFTFNSSIPIAAAALRGFTNERGEFLISNLPVNAVSVPLTFVIPVVSDLSVLPHFADGGGWTTQVNLVNPTDSVLTGTVQFRGPSGEAANLTVNGEANSSFAFSIPARASQTLRTSGASTPARTGSVRVVPAANTPAPSSLAIFSFRNNDGVTVTETSIPAGRTGTGFALSDSLIDGWPTANKPIQRAFSIANMSSSEAAVTFSATNSDSVQKLVVTIPANGQKAFFLNPADLSFAFYFPDLYISSTAPVALAEFRARFNERNDFLLTAMPMDNPATAPLTFPLFLPIVLDSGGYTTQFFISAENGARLFTPSGEPWNLNVQSNP